MNDRALRYFLAVVRTGSIRAAAEVLNVAASAVSRQIAEMEAECGEMLLERLPRGVVVTEAGRVVAEHAQLRADEAALLVDRLRRFKGVQRGTVRVCCGAGFLVDLMENGIAPFSAAHAGITFAVSLGTTDEILAAVADTSADIGLAYNPPAHPGIRGVKVSRQPLAAILPLGHPLARSHEPVGLEAFTAEPVALLPRSHAIRQLLGRVEANGGFRLTPTLETSSFEAQRRFVAAGMGAAFLPGFAVLAELRTRAVQTIGLTDPLLSDATVHLVLRAGRRVPEAVASFVSFLEDNLVALGAEPPTVLPE